MPCKNIIEKKEFVEIVWPAHSAFSFTCRPIASKQLNSMTTMLLSIDSVVQRLRIRFGCERSRVQFLAPAWVFMFDLFCFVVVVFFTFLSNHTVFVTKFCNFFCNVNIFSIVLLNMLQDV